jgi:hypothetical protein
MIPVVISASAYESNSAACLKYINELIRVRPELRAGLLLDQQFLHSHAGSSATEALPVQMVRISDWIDASQQPLTVEIRCTAVNLSKDTAVLLDARHFDTHIVAGVLHQVSHAWFRLSAWQPAFILVADDFHSPQLARELSGTFYIQSLSTSRQAIRSESANMYMHIFFHRWLGFGRLSRAARSMHIFSQKLKRYVYKYFS